MNRGYDESRPHWLYQFLLKTSADEASNCIEPNFVKVLKQVAGPIEDGSVRKQISDGDIFMDAVFSLEAISSGILHDDSQINWDRCELLLKNYHLRYETTSVNKNSADQMVLVVNECVIMGSEYGFSLKESPSFCMTRPELQKKLQRYHRKLRPAEGGSCRVESNLAVSLLMAQMSNDIAGRTHSQALHLDPCMALRGPPDLGMFVVSAEDQLRLDTIEEWLSDYFPVEETPSVPPTTSSSDVAVQSHSGALSEERHRETAPPLPAPHPKTLCDASCQVTLPLRETTIRPTTAEVGVEVGDSLMLNTQAITDRARADSSEETNLPSDPLPPLQTPCVQDFPQREELWSSGSSLRLSCDEEPNDLMLNTQAVTDRARADDSEESNLSVAVPPSNLLPLLQASCVQDFPQREELWSSGSSLRLSCDEEPNDLRPDPNLEMLGQKLLSSDSSTNMTVDDASPVGIPTSKTTTPPSSRVTAVSGPSTRKTSREKSTLDSITTGVLFCSDPERLDPVVGTQMNLQFIQSTQIGYLSSQYCPVEPDFPLSPVRRAKEMGRSTQSFEPFTFETTPINVAETVHGAENVLRARNVPRWGTVSGVCETVLTGGIMPGSQIVSVSANVSKGGSVPDGEDVPNGGNVPNSGNVANVESGARGTNPPAGGKVPSGGGALNGQSVLCRASIQSAGESNPTCRDSHTDENVLSVGKSPDALVVCRSHPKTDGGSVCSSRKGSHTRNVSNNEMASTGKEKTISNSGSLNWSSLPDMISFGSGARENGAKKCGNGDDGKRMSNAVECVSEMEGAAEEVSVGRVVGCVWISPTARQDQRAGEREMGKTRAAEKVGEKEAVGSKAGKQLGVNADKGKVSEKGKAIECPACGRRCDAREGERVLANDYENIMDNVRKDKNLSDVRIGHVTRDDVRMKNATKNDVRIKSPRRELNISPCHTKTSDRCQLISTDVSVCPQLSVSKKSVPANVPVSGTALSSESVSVLDRLSSAPRVSVTNQETSAIVSVSKHIAPATASVSGHLDSASLPLSRQIPVTMSTTGRPVLQSLASRSDLRIHPATLNSLSLSCANICLPVSVAATTHASSTNASVGCLPASAAQNQPKGGIQSSCRPDLSASGEMPFVSERGGTGTRPCATSKPTEVESEETEMDSFDELLIKSADSTKLHAELECRKSSPNNTVDPVENSVHKLQVVSVSTHKRPTDKDCDVVTNDKKQSSGEKKKRTFAFHAKRSKLSLSERRDPRALFAKHDPRKLPENRKRKLLNIVDQVLEGISSSDNQADSDNIDTRFGALGKQQGTHGSALDGNNVRVDVGRKSKKTDSKEKVDATARVTVERSPSGRHLGNTDRVTNGTSALKTLSREIAEKPNSVGQTKKSRMGDTAVACSSLAREGLTRAVGLEHTPPDRSGHSDHVAAHVVKNRGTATAAGVNSVQTAPLEFTIAEESRGHNSKTGTPQSGNCRLSEGRSWTKHRQHVETSPHSRDRRSSVDMFAGQTNKPNNTEDTTYPQLTHEVVPKGRDKLDTQSQNNSSAGYNQQPDRSVARQTTNCGAVTGGTRSHYREIVETFGARAGSKSGGSQTSDRLTLPTPKNSLPSHQPPRLSLPNDSVDQMSSVSSERSSSPKFNRDRIKMLIGRDKMTADAAKAFSSSDLPENLKHWTFAYFKNWS